MAENEIIKYEGLHLQAVSNSLEITNKLLTQNDRQKIIDLFTNHPDFFRQIISQNYKLSNSLIKKYENHWDWSCIVYNRYLDINEDFIEKYKHKLNWESIVWKERIHWTEKLIEKYKNENNFLKGLSKSEKIPWSDALIMRYSEQWDWYYLASNETINWTESFIESQSYRNGIWKGISCNKKFICSEDFICKNSEKLEWENFSSNPNINWTKSNSSKKKLHF